MLKKVIGHFTTITRHKILVMKECFKIGLYKQGLTHDLSKYSPTEFLVGCKYYQGNRSPNNAEREETGCIHTVHHLTQPILRFPRLACIVIQISFF